MSDLRGLIEQLLALSEKKGTVGSLKFPADCDQRNLMRAAKKAAVIKHGGNHDTVIDKKTGRVITQIPRHDPRPGTCRAIIKDLKRALG